MSQITLIRHGQANSTARDEASYDSLSDLGSEQARWLGAHFRDVGEEFDRVYTGSLTRHVQTAEALEAAGWATPVVDERLNEVRYFDLSTLMHEQYGLAPPQSQEEFIDHMPLVFQAWQDGRIANAPESFQDFQSRVDEALQDIAAGEGRALVVTSGGLIGMAVRVAMGLELGAFARLILTIMNTSVHRMNPVGSVLTLTQFNAVPHLDRHDRRFAQTYV